MAKPTTTTGAIAGLLNTTIASGGSRTAAALVDLGGAFDGAVTCRIQTGASAPNAGTTFAAYRAGGQAAATPAAAVAGAVSQGATTVSVSSNASIVAGQRIALIPAAGAPGELATVSSIAGTGPYTVTLSTGTSYAYSANDKVFAVEQTPTGGQVTPGPSSGSTYSTNSVYSTSIYPRAGYCWIVAATNGDTTASNSVTATATLDKVTAIG